MKAEIMDVPLFIQWLEETKMLMPSSLYAYRINIEAFLKTNPDIDNIEDYNKFIIERGIKGRSYHIYFVLKRFIEYKFTKKDVREILLENLLKTTMPTTIKKERRYLKPDEIYNVISHMKDERHQLIAWIQHETGVRAGDILRMKKGQIVPETYGEFSVLSLRIVGKRNKRIVATIFNKDLQQQLLDYQNIHSITHTDDDYLFLVWFPQCRTNDEMTLRANYNRYLLDVKQACQASGINPNDFATHDYRRCFARRVWEKTKDITILKQIMNHNDMDTTVRYLKTSGLQNIDVYRDMQTNK